ncbi:MAG TPA: MG2 domain-containing protein, partial [Verrucomicrobiae bacterium]
MRILFLLLAALGGFAADFEKINPEGERLYAEKSFGKAHDSYEAMDVSNLSVDEKRWVEFRRADTAWRSIEKDGDDDLENTRANKAEDVLRRLVEERDRADEQDRVWAEAEESLGHLLMRTQGRIRPMHLRRRANDYSAPRGEEWDHIEKALDWWARSRDLELARKRYIALVWSVFNDGANYYNAASLAPALENVAKIANSADDRARAHFVLAQIISQRSNPNEIERANAEFEAAIAVGKESQWYDDALFAYAQWLTHSGRVKYDDNGNAVAQPNAKKALELFRKLTAEFNERDSPYVRQAKQLITQIEAPQLNVNVSSMFLPNSAPQFDVSFKNVRQVEFTVRRVDVMKEVVAPDQRRGFGNWGSLMKAGSGEVVKRWTKDFSDHEQYVDHYESLPIEDKLTPGAYLLEATAAGLSAQDLMLVTDIAVVANSATDRTVIYVCNAETGAPVAKAPVRLFELYYNNQNMASRTRDGATDENGLVDFPTIDKTPLINQAFALANFDGRPGISTVYPNHYQSQPEGAWRMYVVTDRPAYRPNETMHWKVTARLQQNNLYTTPAGVKLQYVIQDQRAQKVKEGEITLNSFGSGWGELKLTSEMTLGQYQIIFSEGQRSYLGTGAFRLEEYKLPEFKVTVQTPEENGRPKIFRLGERVEVTVKGEYYFGGAVANASVHVIVRKNSLYHIYRPERAYAWYFDDFGARYRWRGQGEVALEKDLTTDAEGKTTLSLETAAFGNDDVEFTVEARMTDASRREIIGTGNIRVTKHRYQVYASAKHWIHRPNEKAQIEFHAFDANDQGVAVEGKIKVTRDFWREKNYEHEDITSATVKTDAEGKAEFAFTPAKDGYYRIAWVSEDKRPDGSDGPPVKA